EQRRTVRAIRDAIDALFREQTPNIVRSGRQRDGYDLERSIRRADRPEARGEFRLGEIRLVLDLPGRKVPMVERGRIELRRHEDGPGRRERRRSVTQTCPGTVDEFGHNRS